MATLREMLQMRETFEKPGLKFTEITNHEVMWTVSQWGRGTMPCFQHPVDATVEELILA